MLTPTDSSLWLVPHFRMRGEVLYQVVMVTMCCVNIHYNDTYCIDFLVKVTIKKVVPEANF